MKLLSLLPSLFVLLLPLTAAFERPHQRALVEDGKELDLKSRIAALAEEPDFGRFLESNVSETDGAVCQACAPIAVEMEGPKPDLIAAILASLSEVFLGPNTPFGFLAMTLADLFEPEPESVPVEPLLSTLIQASSQLDLILADVEKQSAEVTADVTEVVVALFDLITGVISAFANLINGIITILASILTQSAGLVASIIIAIFTLIEYIILAIFQLIGSTFNAIVGVGADVSAEAFAQETSELKVLGVARASEIVELYDDITAKVARQDVFGFGQVLTDSEGDILNVTQKLVTVLGAVEQMQYEDSPNSDLGTFEAGALVSLFAAVGNPSLLHRRMRALRQQHFLTHLVAALFLFYFKDVVVEAINIITSTIIAVIGLIVGIITAVIG